MDFPLGSVTALIFCRSGGGSLVACSVDLIVVSFDVFCALVGCIILLPELNVVVFVEVVLVVVDVVVQLVK